MAKVPCARTGCGRSVNLIGPPGRHVFYCQDHPGPEGQQGLYRIKAGRA